MEMKPESRLFLESLPSHNLPFEAIYFYFSFSGLAWACVWGFVTVMCGCLGEGEELITAEMKVNETDEKQFL